ncbi:RNA ligase-domain-containing protein [Flammula alnicola]|nr:RNA ligase-domain-containing protein [Flammula alnicola]
MAPRQSSEDSDLIASLHAISAKSPKLVKASVYPAPADPSIQVRSWKMNEFKYYDIPSPFPTLARGLFTKEVRTTVVLKKELRPRGTRRRRSTSNTRSSASVYPILKSNGCIIFIAALTPTKLLVTSKHSLGPPCTAGEAWLRKYLDKVGKKEDDLAATLWEKNWTAIAELCDDSFEEHVLAYPPEKTGLHLHGLNLRSKAFVTMPAEIVDDFAEEWGFIKTPHTTLNSIQEVKDFTTACAESGEWNGEAVEGFVVRTHVTEPPTSGRGGDKGKDKETAPGQGVSRSPYKAGSSFFFKVKFDEPYMMYRDWREVTKTLLSAHAKGPMNASMLPKSKMKRAETKLYVKWVIQEIKRDPAAFAQYAKGKGIIATRERYLKWLKSDKGEHDLQEVQKEEEQTKGNFGKTVIVPVAIPGCGKTAVSVALAHLFGFGHTQSDDVHAKKPAPIFIKNVMNLLDKYNVVIADKNNHLKQHRKALRDATADMSPPVRLLALNWALDKPPATVHRICGDRVQERGDNHQTLRADPSSSKSHEEVIWMFINTTEELTPSEVDNIVEMDIEEGLEAAVRRAVKGCVEVLGLEQPSEEKIAEALEVVQGYAPAVKKPDEPKDSKKKAEKTPRYFGLLPEVDLVALLDERLSQDDVDNDMRDFWAMLKAEERVIKMPHVTIVHKNAMDTERALWDRCAALHAMPIPPVFKGKLGSVVFNRRVMAVTVEDFALETPGDAQAQQGQEFVSKLPHEIRERLHITVGTRANIQPVEAKAMVETWRAEGPNPDLMAVGLKGKNVLGRVKGLYG